MSKIVPQEEHPLTRPKQSRQSYFRQLFLHPRHSAPIGKSKEVRKEA